MKSVVINAAGGGSDTGATGNGLREKDVTLEISNIIKNILESKVVDVYMLRDGDKTISYDERIKDLKNKYPNGKDVIVLSNTLNSGGDSGIEIIYSINNKDTLANLLDRNLEYFNKTKYYQLRYPQDTTKDYYYITRNTPGYETIIVRYGYVDNAGDANILKNSASLIAEAVADSILDYLGVFNEDYYKVKSGDTLYAIAKKYNTTVDEIKKLNNLKSESLSINQLLKIPGYNSGSSNNNSNTGGTNTYIVKSGDTLYSIAKKFGTNVDTIKDINNLKNNTISINQVLYVPGGKTHKVVKGDTLYAIANKYNTSVDEIKSLNKLTSNNLQIGTILYIP